ncbi:hypothetical protein JCM10207_003471 [Rhodosporidiobolus poonsookiae]
MAVRPNSPSRSPPFAALALDSDDDGQGTTPLQGSTLQGPTKTMRVGHMSARNSGFEVVSRGRRKEEREEEEEKERGEDPPSSTQRLHTSHPSSSSSPTSIELVPPTPISPVSASYPPILTSTSAPTLPAPHSPPSLHRRRSLETLRAGLRSVGEALPLVGGGAGRGGKGHKRTASGSSASSALSKASSSTSTASRSPRSTASPASPSALASLLARTVAAPPVKLTLVNRTPFAVSFAHWPVRRLDAADGREGETVALQAWRGGGVVEGSVPCDLSEEELEKGEMQGMGQGEVRELGTIRRPEKRGVLSGHEHTEGWIFFDLSLPPPPHSGSSTPYTLHLQSYLRLSTTGSARAALGRFDLDSNTDRPCPSGVCGRVEVVRRQTKAGTEDEKESARPGLSRVSTSASEVPTLPGDADADIKDRATELGEVVEVRYILTPECAELGNTVDDSTKEGRFWVPGKGVVVSSWVSVEGVSLSVILGNEARYHEYYPSSATSPIPLLSPRPPSSSIRSLSPSRHRRHSSSASALTTASTRSGLQSLSDPHPMRTSKHKLEGLDWRSCWLNVRKGRETLLDKTVKVNPLHGSAVGLGVVSTLETPVVFHDAHGLAISYGFFDSGMLRAKEMYIYAARKNTTWLADLVEEDPRVLEVPFEKLALAGAHDAGMLGSIDPQLLHFLHRGDGDDLPAVALALPFVRFLLGLLESFGMGAERMLSNLSMTQKDSIRAQLEMGIRFFDFRPGYSLYDIVDEVKGPLRHQHAIVPGVSYEFFLIDVLAFLADNPGEIVVVELKDDGFPFRTDTFDPSSPTPLKPTAISMVPTVPELAAALAGAKASSPLAAREINVGGAADLRRTVGELLRENRRLVIVDRVHEAERREEERWERWERADSYTHEAYDTDDPLKVLAALNVAHSDAAIRAAQKRGPSSTIYQLQATPTAQIWSDIGASLTYSDASSLLVWSKARMDRVTLLRRADDFVDPALVHHAVEKSRERVAVYLAKQRQRSGSG